MITTRELARLVVAGALAATLVGCTSSGGSPDDPAAPTTSGASSEDAVEEPVEEPEAEGPFVDVPPADEIAEAFTVPVTASGGSAGGDTVLGPVFTADLIVFTDDRGFLHAIDRATGQEQWRVKRRHVLNGGDTPCALTHPTPDAEVVVVNHGGGELCGDFTVYSLADGSITEKYDSVPRIGREIGFDLASNSDLAVVDGRTYFLDGDGNLLRIEADGTTSTVGSPAVLVDAETEWSVHNLMVLPGSDVMTARLTVLDGEIDFDEDENGKLIGFRVNDSDLPELLWTQDIRKLMSKKSSPGHIHGKFDLVDEVPGAVADQFRADGAVQNRYRVIDPETGELSSPGFIFDRDPDDLPAFLFPYVVDQSVRATDSSVFTPIAPRGQQSPIAVRRVDLASGEALWSWSIPGAAKRGTLSSTADVVSTSPDGALVYVRTAVDYDGRLWELDADTGEVVRSWRFSDKRPEVYDLDNATVSMDDGDVFRLSNSTTGDKLLAALYR